MDVRCSRGDLEPKTTMKLTTPASPEAGGLWHPASTVATPDGQRTLALHARLRQMILDGELRPGAILSQIQLSQSLEISRTPLREALRMLQQEGLITSEPNRRVHVAPLDLEDLEFVYSERIMLETLGLALTTTRFTPADLDEMADLLRECRDATEKGDRDRFNQAHRKFHRALVSSAPNRLQSTVGQLIDRSERYRNLYAAVSSSNDLGRPVAVSEHDAIYEACEAGEPVGAAEQLGRHLARTALSIMAVLAPEHDPAVVRTALQMIVRDRGDATVRELSHLSSPGLNSAADPATSRRGRRRRVPPVSLVEGSTNVGQSSNRSVEI
jgi:DNA-binding GntR family transcriptional regulator